MNYVRRVEAAMENAESHDDHVGAGVQSLEVLGIRRHDPVAACPGSEYDQRVDDVGGSTNAAQLPGFVRATIVEPLDLVGREQPGQARLSPVVRVVSRISGCDILTP